MEYPSEVLEDVPHHSGDVMTSEQVCGGLGCSEVQVWYSTVE